MRLLYSFLVLFFSVATGFAQQFTPVIVNGEVFFKTELLTDEGLIPAEVTVTNLTTIDNLVYFQVFLKRDFEPDMHVGYLREDPGTSELFFRPLASNQEQLIYTMALEVDDQITLPARWCDGQNSDVATVVAIQMVNGLQEIVFDRMVGEGEICETLRFLEGVGPSVTVLYPYLQNQPIQNGAAQRICHASHSAVIYYPSNTDTDFCGLTIVDTEELTDQSIQIWPNPTSGTLQMEGIKRNDQLFIYNAQGKLVKQTTARNQLNIQHLEAGWYWLQITREGKTISTHKLAIVY